VFFPFGNAVLDRRNQLSGLLQCVVELHERLETLRQLVVFLHVLNVDEERYWRQLENVLLSGGLTEFLHIFKHELLLSDELVVFEVVENLSGILLATHHASLFHTRVPAESIGLRSVVNGG